MTRIGNDEMSAMRAEVYRWLAGVFAREPTAAMLAGYRSPEGRGVLLRLAEMEPLGEGAAGLLAMVNDETDLEAMAFDLAGTYARLFLGAGGPSAVSPYESVHTSPERRLFQQATTDMERLLAEYGLSVAGAPEPADHIAVELEFLAELILAGETALERRLLDEHLLRWAPAFCDACIERDATGYYAAAARMLRGMLEIDAA
ncbi:MAG TPA: molecular chaperone TorD family protein [Azospirillum sp.]|nr:molecular chaperone TorD family protein [Azospirillum sp.]